MIFVGDYTRELTKDAVNNVVSFAKFIITNENDYDLSSKLHQFEEKFRFEFIFELAQVHEKFNIINDFVDLIICNYPNYFKESKHLKEVIDSYFTIIKLSDHENF